MPKIFIFIKEATKTGWNIAQILKLTFWVNIFIDFLLWRFFFFEFIERVIRFYVKTIDIFIGWLVNFGLFFWNIFVEIRYVLTLTYDIFDWKSLKPWRWPVFNKFIKFFLSSFYPVESDFLSWRLFFKNLKSYKWFFKPSKILLLILFIFFNNVDIFIGDSILSKKT